MKTGKIITMMMVGMAALAMAGCGDDRQAQRQEDQNKTMQYWMDLSKETELALNTEEIYPGVTVMGVDLGGKTVAEATALIEQKVNEQILTHEVVLYHEDQKWTFTFDELGVSVDSAAVAQRAYEVGRTGDLRQRSMLLNSLADQSEGLPMDMALDEEKLTAALENLAEEIEEEPVDAVLNRKDGEFVITPEKNGTALDWKMTVADIQEALKAGEDGVEIQLLLKEAKPEITAELLSEVKDKIGSGLTYYSTSNADREQNLIVGSSKLNGMVVMPDEVVSFNEAVAPITAENGYRAANVIQGGEYVLDLGGGLCQVSTTLYNAAIRAELEIIERDCHAFPSDYVQMGLDAAVAQGYIDFQFRNNTGYPIYISMWCGGGEIGAAIYGKESHDPSRSVSFDYVITDVIEKPKAKEVEDSTLKPGERVVEVEGHTGYTVDTYKTVTENGESYTEWFSTSYYMASADKVKVGPKKTGNAESGTSQTPTMPTTPTTPSTPENSEETGSLGPETPPQESTPVEESAPNQESSAGQDSAATRESSLAAVQ